MGVGVGGQGSSLFTLLQSFGLYFACLPPWWALCLSAVAHLQYSAQGWPVADIVGMLAATSALAALRASREDFRITYALPEISKMRRVTEDIDCFLKIQ